MKQRDTAVQGDQEVLDSIRPQKIILPTLIGLGVIYFLVRSQLDMDALADIRWSGHAFLWIIIAILAYAVRHMFYSYRIKTLSEGDFSWGKSIELVTILEFASCVSPTNFGGSAVAFFLLIQEKISAARATAMVIYTIIVDTLFFVLLFPLAYLFVGRNFFLPSGADATTWGGMRITLIAAWSVMTVYGLLLLYGLFVQPKQIRRLLYTIARWPLFNRSKERIQKAAEDIEVSSLHIRNMKWTFHCKLILATLFAWICRFFVVTAILIALDPSLRVSLYDQMILQGRGAAVYAVTAYSPTPGGSGVAEIIFGQFYQEYVVAGVSVIAALLWRVITYYPYLILGVIIIPNWIRKIINRRREEKASDDIVDPVMSR